LTRHQKQWNSENPIRKRNQIIIRRIKEKLKASFLGQTIHRFYQVTSTNELAKDMALLGAKEGTVIIAETQTKGRGRLGREWMSPEGGIWLSVILRPKLNAKDAPKLTLIASLAVAQTINQLFNLRAEVKWPNDVLINAKKVCGILTEANTKGDTINFVVVGVGVNANIELGSLPEEVRQNATSLKHELKREINRELFLKTLLEKMEHYYFLLLKGKFNHILMEWKNLCGILNSYVEVTSLKEKVEGWAVDVDENGALLIKLRNGTLKRVLSGDVALVRRKGLRHQKR
jgi:BirA family biotin operon repressor/biotin-[acetyl-CoA-carboxylase] ligase